MTILCLTHVLAYVIRLGDSDFEDSLLRGQLDSDCAQLVIPPQQGVVYRQAANVRQTEDVDGLF